jgi:hypothetical protein
MLLAVAAVPVAAAVQTIKRVVLLHRDKVTMVAQVVQMLLFIVLAVEAVQAQ